MCCFALFSGGEQVRVSNGSWEVTSHRDPKGQEKELLQLLAKYEEFIVVFLDLYHRRLTSLFS